MRKTIKEIKKEIDIVNSETSKENYKLNYLFAYRDGLLFTLGEKEHLKVN